MEEGVVVRLQKDKKFCFIEREGKDDLHCSTRFLPELENGDRLSFEEVEGRDGRPTARKVKILSRADGTPYAPGQKPGTAVDLKVDVEFNDPHPWTRPPAKKNKPLVSLPTWLTLTRGGPVLNHEIELVEVDGEKKSETATTTADGKAFFRLVLSNGTTDCQFAVIVDGKRYSFFWPPRVEAEQTKAAQTKKDTEPPKDNWTIEVVNPPRDPDSTGWFPVNVVTKNNDKKADARFSAGAETRFEVQQETKNGRAVVTDFTSTTPGDYRLWVGFDGVMTKITFQLDNGTKAAVWLSK